MGEQLSPGRELDGVIARHVFDWVEIDANARWRRWEYGDPGDEWTMIDEPWCRGLGLPPESIHGRCPYPRYSTDIAAAWPVAEKLKIGVMPRGDGWIAFKQGSEWGDSGYIWDLGIDIPLTHLAEAETAPHAICLCALRVVRATLDP